MIVTCLDLIIQLVMMHTTHELNWIDFKKIVSFFFSTKNAFNLYSFLHFLQFLELSFLFLYFSSVSLLSHFLSRILFSGFRQEKNFLPSKDPFRHFFPSLSLEFGLFCNIYMNLKKKRKGKEEKWKKEVKEYKGKHFRNITSTSTKWGLGKQQMLWLVSLYFVKCSFLEFKIAYI